VRDVRATLPQDVTGGSTLGHPESTDTMTFMCIATGKHQLLHSTLWHFGFQQLSHLVLFFWKHPRALGIHVGFLDVHTDRTQLRRDCPSNLGTRHTEDAHHYTHTPSTHAHKAPVPRCGRGLEPPPVGSHQRELPLGQRPIRGFMTLNTITLLTWQGERRLEFHGMWEEFHHHETHMAQLSSSQSR